MERRIRVAIDTPAGLQHEILAGAIRQDEAMAVVEPPADGTRNADADVVIVSQVRDLRAREPLEAGERVLAIDDHDQQVHLYEVRPLGQAGGAADLTAVIRSLTPHPLRERVRLHLARWLRTLVTPPTRRAP